MSQKVTNKWKIVAIVFIILFVAETSLIIWWEISYNNEVEKTNECYYDICGDYEQAWYELNVCSCYSWDPVSGEYILEKTKTMYD